MQKCPFLVLFQFHSLPLFRLSASLWLLLVCRIGASSRRSRSPVTFSVRPSGSIVVSGNRHSCVFQIGTGHIRAVLSIFLYSVKIEKALYLFNSISNSKVDYCCFESYWRPRMYA
ncbi:hypothetical protein RJT34_03824 [Clitoria ternatea]|uniref:Uncharacterized protein n=1 Tax=Clitoria ternatea TaxID=43366 RepID=A0AAN9KLF9_CLITE